MGVNMSAKKVMVGLKKPFMVRKVMTSKSNLVGIAKSSQASNYYGRPIVVKGKHLNSKAMVVTIQDLVAKAKVAKQEALDMQQKCIDEQHFLPRIVNFEIFCAMYQQELDVALEENKMENMVVTISQVSSEDPS